MQKRANKSPWIHQLPHRDYFKPLYGHSSAQLTIIGAGISGAVSAYFVLKYTALPVLLLEADKIAHGATGHNAGYIVADFERTYESLEAEYGEQMTEAAYEELESAWGLLAEICTDIGVNLPDKTLSLGYYSNYDRFLNEIIALSEEATRNEIYIKKDSPWIEKISKEKTPSGNSLLSIIKVVRIEDLTSKYPVKEKLFEKADGFVSEKCVVMNSALFTQRLVHYLVEAYPHRFTVHEHSPVTKVSILGHENILIHTDSASCQTKNILLCTNGFENISFYGEDNAETLDEKFHKNTYGVIGYMIGSIVEKRQNPSALFHFPESVQISDSPLVADPYTYTD
jgi:glycine/D-amino acid oxidase-like deaminating enzyme